MKFSKNTLNILKNYASINPSIFFKRGNLLRTLNKGKTILVEATIDETVPADFGVQDLNQLLSILSIDSAPELSLHKNDVVVSGFGGRSKITYRCCDSSMMKTPPEKNIELPSQDASFLLTEPDLAWVLKTASILGSPNIALIGTGGQMALRTLDVHDNSAHTDTLTVGPWIGEDFEFIFKTENWKLLPGTYAVTLSNGGAAHFQNQERKLQYWIATETKTK